MPRTQDNEILYQLWNILNVPELPSVDPLSIIGKTITHKFRGVPIKATIQKSVDDDKVQIQYVNGLEDVISYEEAMAALNMDQEDGNTYWAYESFTGHRGNPDNPSSWQVKVLWDNGEETWEPVPTKRKDDPLEMAK